MLLQSHDYDRQPRRHLLDLPRPVINLEPDAASELEQLAPAEPLLPSRVEAELRAGGAR
jgi:hypothetical protein